MSGKVLVVCGPTASGKTALAVQCAKRLQTEEEISVGISSGAAVAVAKRLANRVENAGKVIVTILPDEGGRYASILHLDGK